MSIGAAMSDQDPSQPVPAADAPDVEITSTTAEGAQEAAVATTDPAPNGATSSPDPTQLSSIHAPVLTTDMGSKDVHMTDAPIDQAPSATAAAAASTSLGSTLATNNNALSPVPTRVSTPMRNNSTSNGADVGAGAGGERTASRAASAHPDPGFTMPAEAPLHGAPVRQYINTKITGVLLEGMKMVAKEQPKDPLRVLGEFLLQRSKELEGTTIAS
ncbi:hypothetical protein B0H66DRAFT_544910 [Apodospora peruviana]|uniref:Dpy-30 domain-containing protein n=1 Tax=Apodospora peruviana TaxID=516989 RepID=A0AAE0MFY6_9PEZI|nr:hypothetical protein B0H66DRAFT_544910 [Apodospora peruviana]